MPLSLVTEGEEVQGVGIVQLPDVTNEEEGNDEAQPSPHPEVEALHRYVHVVPLTEGLETVQTTPLVHEHQVLYKTCQGDDRTHLLKLNTTQNLVDVCSVWWATNTTPTSEHRLYISLQRKMYLCQIY